MPDFGGWFKEFSNQDLQQLIELIDRGLSGADRETTLAVQATIKGLQQKQQFCPYLAVIILSAPHVVPNFAVRQTAALLLKEGFKNYDTGLDWNTETRALVLRAIISALNVTGASDGRNSHIMNCAGATLVACASSCFGMDCWANDLGIDLPFELAAAAAPPNCSIAATKALTAILMECPEELDVSTVMEKLLSRGGFFAITDSAAPLPWVSAVVESLCALVEALVDRQSLSLQVHEWHPSDPNASDCLVGVTLMRLESLLDVLLAVLSNTMCSPSLTGADERIFSSIMNSISSTFSAVMRRDIIEVAASRVPAILSAACAVVSCGSRDTCRASAVWGDWAMSLPTKALDETVTAGFCSVLLSIWEALWADTCPAGRAEEWTRVLAETLPALAPVMLSLMESAATDIETCYENLVGDDQGGNESALTGFPCSFAPRIFNQWADVHGMDGWRVLADPIRKCLESGVPEPRVAGLKALESYVQMFAQHNILDSELLRAIVLPITESFVQKFHSLIAENSHLRSFPVNSIPCACSLVISFTILSKSTFYSDFSVPYIMAHLTQFIDSRLPIELCCGASVTVSRAIDRLPKALALNASLELCQRTAVVTMEAMALEALPGGRIRPVLIGTISLMHKVLRIIVVNDRNLELEQRQRASRLVIPLLESMKVVLVKLQCDSFDCDSICSALYTVIEFALKFGNLAQTDIASRIHHFRDRSIASMRELKLSLEKSAQDRQSCEFAVVSLGRWLDVAFGTIAMATKIDELEPLVSELVSCLTALPDDFDKAAVSIIETIIECFHATHTTPSRSSPLISTLLRQVQRLYTEPSSQLAGVIPQLRDLLGS